MLSPKGPINNTLSLRQQNSTSNKKSEQASPLKKFASKSVASKYYPSKVTTVTTTTSTLMAKKESVDLGKRDSGRPESLTGHYMRGRESAAGHTGSKSLNQTPLHKTGEKSKSRSRLIRSPPRETKASATKKESDKP